MLEITFLGTGISQGVPIICCPCEVCASNNPKDRRLRSSVFIQSKETSLLIDTGPDFRQQALENKIQHLDAILLTHKHRDHVGGMDEIRPYSHHQKANIPVFGHKQTLDEIRKIVSYAFGEEAYPGAPKMEIHELDMKPFVFRDLEITPLCVDHVFMTVTAYRIGNFAYVTDAKFIDKTNLALLEGLDTLVLNSLRIHPHPSHLCLHESLSIIEQLKPRQAFLTHISHDMGLYEQVDPKLPQGVHLAYDGLKIYSLL